MNQDIRKNRALLWKDMKQRNCRKLDNFNKIEDIIWRVEGGEKYMRNTRIINFGDMCNWEAEERVIVSMCGLDGARSVV